MRAKSYVDQFLIRHEFIKALHARYRQEGIVIPYPMRTLDVPEELLDRLEQRLSASASPRPLRRDPSAAL